PDLVVVERTKRRAGRRDLVAVALAGPREARGVLVREHLQHARERERAGGVDPRDPPPGHLAGDDAAIREVGCLVLGCVPRLARHLGAPVAAALPSADVCRCHRCPSRAAAWPRPRTMARFASSFLKVLWPKPRASRSSASATRWKLSTVARRPRSRSSASRSRHGLCATPPSATRTSVTVSPSISSAA